VLIDAFNHMLDQIAARTGSSRITAITWRRVTRRTADLLRLNRELTIAKERAEESPG